jgi:hypothetical protein
MKAFLAELLSKREINVELKNNSRKRGNPDIHKAKTFGILYDASTEHEFKVVKEFFKDLKIYGIQANSLGYVNHTEKTFHPLARPESDYFFKHQLNWYQKPTSKEVENFIEKPFDILVNVSIQDFFPLDYIAAASLAKCKIGRNQGKYAHIYDMAIATEGIEDTKTFVYLIIHILSQINAPKKSVV